MRCFKVMDIVKERQDCRIGEVTKVDYLHGFDEVWVTFDNCDSEQCYGSKELMLVAKIEDRKDL